MVLIINSILKGRPGLADSINSTEKRQKRSASASVQQVTYWHFLKVEFPVLLSMMILSMFIQHNSSKAVPLKNSSVQYWVTSFNTVCDLLEVIKSTVTYSPCVGTCLFFSQTFTLKVPAVCSSWQSTPQTAHLLSPWFSPTSARPTNNTITLRRPATSQSFQTWTVRHDIRQRNKSCHCMATEIRLAKWFHVYSWNISCSDCSLWWWGKIRNVQRKYLANIKVPKCKKIGVLT